MTRQEIIKSLEKKEFYGTIDRLERGEITEKQAESEANGKLPEVEISKQQTPYQFAMNCKQKKIEKQESWSRWIIETRLHPGMDAINWYKIYDAT